MIRHGETVWVSAKGQSHDLVKDSPKTCRHCGATVTYRTVKTPGYLPRTGWADDAPRDALVCFRALTYSHDPA